MSDLSPEVRAFIALARIRAAIRDDDIVAYENWCLEYEACVAEMRVKQGK